MYVFDGKPPELKMATLAGRKDKKDEAVDALALAKVSRRRTTVLVMAAGGVVSKTQL